MEKHNDYGFIININSIVGHSIPAVQGVKFNVYPGTKHAITATTEVMRRELIGMNRERIRVAVINYYCKNLISSKLVLFPYILECQSRSR